MNIGMIGAGSVAISVARHALRLGHRVILSNKNGGERLSKVVSNLGNGAEAGSALDASRAELVLFAVPWPEVEGSLKALPNWEGRILVDATNPFAAVSPKLVLAELNGRGASEIVTELAPGARVVKAFNSIKMSNFDRGPMFGDARRVLFVSGDDPAAKGTVKELITSFGFSALDLGGLSVGGRLQQAGGPLAGPDFLIAS